MKILIVNYEYPPLGGGGGVATKQLAEEMAKRHEVHVLTTWYQGLLKHEEINSVIVHRVRVLGRKQLPTATILSMLTFVLAAIWRGLFVCQEVKFDVLNAQFVVPSGVPGAVLAKMFRLPFVLSFIGGDLYDPSKGVSPHRHPILRVLIQWVSAQADICTAISEDTKMRALDIHGVSKEIVVTHLGLIPHDVGRKTRAEVGLPEHVPIFSTVGRLINRKGYETLIRAWKDIPTAHLVIMGSGPLERRLKRLTSELEISGRVHFLGFVEELRKLEILKASTAYVSATEHEGFGIVFLEAMEAGLPIVSTDTGGQRDFLIEGENAILVPVGDVKQLAGAIAWMLKDSRLRNEMSKNNREKVKDFYLEKTARRFEEVLMRVYESRD